MFYSLTTQTLVNLVSFATSLVLLGASAQAATMRTTEKIDSYLISSQIFVDGVQVSSPRIIVLENERATVSQRSQNGDELKIEVVAYDQDGSASVEQGIRMDFDVVYQNDGRKVRSRPQIVALPNEEASITLSDQKDSSSFELKVLVERQ